MINKTAYNDYASSLVLPKYSFTLNFENTRTIYFFNDLIIDYPNSVYVVSGVYLFSIFFIRWLMTKRESFPLKTCSLLWNASLAVINFIAFMRLFPHLWFVLRREHFFVSLCADWSFIYDQVCGTWLALFPYIKILELGDTFFIVLQKRYLNSYYWCHHLIALLGSWYIYPFYPALSLWLCAIVSLSHIPVYLYAFVRALEFVKISIYVPFLLIFSEIVTVLSGALLSLSILYYQSTGRRCDIDMPTAIVSFVIFSSCCFLLCIFVNNRRKYINSKQAKSNA